MIHLSTKENNPTFVTNTCQKIIVDYLSIIYSRSNTLSFS